MRINIRLSRSMSPEERRYWKAIEKTIEPHFIDSLPKQEALLDYVRARIEIGQIMRGHRIALDRAGEDPLDAKALLNLTRWNSLLVKAEAKAERLRSSIGFHARYEDQRRTIKRVEKDPKARLNEKEPHPWEV